MVDIPVRVVDIQDGAGKALVVVSGIAATLTLTLEKPTGTNYGSLSGKTCTFTVRAEDAPDTVITSDPANQLEGVSATGGASGVMTCTLTAALSALLGPPDSGGVDVLKAYIVHAYVSTDTFRPAQVGRFYVRRAP